nr:hypothetical protein [Tanacetum cinerariifolium]
LRRYRAFDVDAKPPHRPPHRSPVERAGVVERHFEHGFGAGGQLLVGHPAAFFGPLQGFLHLVAALPHADVKALDVAESLGKIGGAGQVARGGHLIEGRSAFHGELGGPAGA